MDKDGVPLNYVKVTGLKKRNGLVTGVFAKDMETEEELEFDGRVGSTPLASSATTSADGRSK